MRHGAPDCFLPKGVVDRLKAEYPPGTRVELVSMDDPYTRLRPGDQGIVAMVDDIGTIHVDWDSGSSLGVAYRADEVKRL